jgi:HlyD family secretion protein
LRGQRVVIRLTGYPHTEYGTIESRVMEVALLAAEKNYAIEIGLPDGLKTSAGRTLELRGELTGEADIITEERSLMERMAGNIF